MKSASLAYRIFCLAILAAAIVQVAFLAPAHSAEKAPDAVSVPAPAPATTTDQNAAHELENKLQVLEAKERLLSEQENRIKDREKELDKKLAEMERLRQAVSGELDAQKKNNEERVLKMVAVFESMSPKSGASVIETLDDWLAVEVLKRMDVKRMAKLMNIMDKNRSAKLSELMTGYFHPEAERKISSVKAAPAASSVPQNPVPAAGQATVAKAPVVVPQQQQKIQKKGGEK